jgi:type IV pilus assembly protein PilO
MNFKKAVFRNTLLVSLGISVLFLYFYWNLFYSSGERRIRELNEEYKGALLSLEKAQLRAKNLDVVRRELDSLLTLWEKVSQFLPSVREIEKWLFDIADAASRAGIEVTLFKPQSPQPQNMYTEYPIEMEVKGGYHELGTFVSFVVNFPRLTKVTALKIKGAKRNSGENYTIEANLKVTTYVFTPHTRVEEDSKKREEKK